MIIVHIGLPKTGTTFLQHRVLKPAYEGAFFHRSSPKVGKVVREIRNKIVERKFDPSNLSKPTMKWASSLSEYQSAILSDENISSRGRDFWDGTGVSPFEVANDLNKLREWLGIPEEEYRVLLGVRAQDQFLASRYAQSAYQAYLKGMYNHGQSDFESKVNFILRSGESLPAFQWLYYNNVKDVFESFFGENVFIYNMDDLKENPVGVLSKMGKMFNKNLTKFVETDIKKKSITRMITSNIWDLSGNDTLEMHDKMARSIKHHFDDHYLESV